MLPEYAKFSSPAVLPKRRASKRRQRRPPHSRLGGPPSGDRPNLSLCRERTIRSRRLLGYLWIRRVFLLGKSRQSTLTASPATVSKRDSLILVSLVACHCFHWGASIFTTSRQIPRPVPSGIALGYCKVYSIVP